MHMEGEWIWEELEEVEYYENILYEIRNWLILKNEKNIHTHFSATKEDSRRKCQTFHIDKV